MSDTVITIKGLGKRFGGVADRLRLNRPGDAPPPPQHFAELVDALRR